MAGLSITADAVRTITGILFLRIHSSSPVRPKPFTRVKRSLGYSLAISQTRWAAKADSQETNRGISPSVTRLSEASFKSLGLSASSL